MELLDELVAKVLQAEEGGLGFTQVSAMVRLVSAGWKAVHDALVTRLVLRGQTTDQAVGMLVRWFPAVASLEYKGGGWRVLTDEALRAVSSPRALTSLGLRYCNMVTAAGVQALPSTTAAPTGLHIDARHGYPSI